MERREVLKSEYVFDEGEAKLVMHCLDYCGHRIREHGKKWIGDLHDIEKLRSRIRVELKSAPKQQI